MSSLKKSPFELLAGGKQENKGLFRSYKIKNVDSSNVSNSIFSTDLFDLDLEFEEFKDKSPKRKEDELVADYVSKRELDSFKELMTSNREHDMRLNEERAIRLEEKIASGNQLILQKIDSSNLQIVGKVESLNKDFEHRIDSLQSNFARELDERFTQEREASAAEAKATRMWLWALAIPSVIGITQIIVAFYT